MTLPLDGVRVLDLSQVIAGPYCGSILAQLGADVVKVEPPVGDPLRKWGSPKGTMIFSLLNSGKKSVVLDLHEPDSIDVLMKLLPGFDVVIVNARAGQMERLGLSFDDCRVVNPGVVYVSLTGFGSIGPYAERPAYDSIAQSFAGLLALVTQGMDKPRVGPALADLMSGLVMSQGALAGLAQRRAGGGRAVLVETSLVESVIALIADTFVDEQTAGRQPDWSARQQRSQIFTLTARDGGDILVHISTSERFFANLCKVLDREDLLSDARFGTYAQRWEHYQPLLAELQQTFATRDRAEWAADLSNGDVPYSSVHSLEEVRAHPQVRALGIFDAVVEDSGVALTRIPWRFDGVRPPRSTIAPELGEHTREILLSVLEGDAAQSLIDRGVARVPDA